MTDYADLLERVRAIGLDILGGFYPAPEDGLPDDAQTLVLLGPHEPGFWQRVQTSAEFADGAPDPLDQWSARVIGDLAEDLGGTALFPFSGPPWHPFFAWAERTGRAWRSPVALLVHDDAGLLVSYRGAVALPFRVDLPPTSACPCDTCDSKPCLTACPVNAITSMGYDIPACVRYLSEGEETPSCMSSGCMVRRVCPVSEAYERDPAQSAYHMKQFLK